MSNLVNAIKKVDWSDVWNRWTPSSAPSSIWDVNKKRMSYVYYKLLELENPSNFPQEYLNLRGPALVKTNTSFEGWTIHYVGFHGWMDIFITSTSQCGTIPEGLNEAISRNFLEMLAQDHYDVVNVISRQTGGTLPLKWKKDNMDLFFGTRYRLILFDTFEVDESKETLINDSFNVITGTASQKTDGVGRVPHMVNIVFHPNQASFWATLNMPLPLETYTGNDPNVFEANFLRFLWL